GASLRLSESPTRTTKKTQSLRAAYDAPAGPASRSHATGRTCYVVRHGPSLAAVRRPPMIASARMPGALAVNSEHCGGTPTPRCDCLLSDRVTSRGGFEVRSVQPPGCPFMG